MINLSELEVICTENKAYRVFGIRHLNDSTVAIGEQLPNSWHNVAECDWIEEDTELDGACCFLVEGGDVKSAIGFCFSQWPDAERFALIGGDCLGESEVPEDGGGVIKNAIVLAIFELSKKV